MPYPKGKPASNAIPVTQERLVKKFFASIDNQSPDKCWNWTGPKQAGYGVLQVGKRKGPNWFIERASRFSYRLHTQRELSRADFICHKCDNPSCVNPDHLFIGTPLENMRDKIQKGRQAVGEKTNNTKLTAEDVREILRLRRNGLPYHEIAQIFNVDKTTTCRIGRGKTWAHIFKEF